MPIKLEFPHFKSKNNNVHVIEMLRGLKEITRRRAHQNAWRLARAQQVSIALPWLSLNSAEARSFPFHFLPCLEVSLSINRIALRTSLSTPSCSVFSLHSMFSSGPIIGDIIVGLCRVYYKTQGSDVKAGEYWGIRLRAGDGLKSSQSVGLVTVVGMRFGEGCRIGRGSLSRGSGPSQHRLDPRELGAR